MPPNPPLSFEPKRQHRLKFDRELDIICLPVRKMQDRVEDIMGMSYKVGKLKISWDDFHAEKVNIEVGIG